jgi:hypothetical protein
MALIFNQKEVELNVADILATGDITKISNLTGIGYSYIDQQLNPNDERRSAIYCALLIQCAMDEISPERGEQLWQLITKLRESSKPVDFSPMSASREAGKFAKESGEALQARLDQRPLYEQLEEAMEAEAQAKKLKMAIISEINAEKEEFNAARTRIKAVK